MIEYFSQFGNVLNAYVIYDPSTKASKKFGYVEFETVGEAELAMNNHSHRICGKRVTVENQKSGVNTAQALGRRVESEISKKVVRTKRTDPKTRQNVSYGLNHNFQEDAAQNPSTLRHKNSLVTEHLILDLGLPNGNFWEGNRLSKPWLKVINQHECDNYNFTVESQESAHIRNCRWRRVQLEFM